MLVEAHRGRVTHGDLKPGNLLVVEGADGKPVVHLADFGLAGALAKTATEKDPLAHLRIYSTLEFLPPEIIEGRRADPRSDVYALGALAHRLFCGEPLFPGKPMEVLDGHRGQEPVPPSRRAAALGVGLPAKVDRLVLRCVEKDPARRIGSVEVLERELRNLACLTAAEPGKMKGARPLTRAPEEEQQSSDEAPLPASPALVRELLYQSIQELGRMALARRVVADQMEQELAQVARVEQAVRLAGQKHEELEERVEGVRQELREREASLRYAIIDLSLTRDGAGPGSAAVGDLDFQISELEQRLARLEIHRAEVFATLGVELARHREEVDAEEQRRASCHRRILGQTEAVRGRLTGEDAAGLFHTITRCQGALARRTV